jgi:septal ring factor EnvC (AmiA/AmiB activator)
VTSNRRHRRFIGICLVSLLPAGFDPARAQDDEAAALYEVQSEIRELEDRLAGQQAKREAGWRALRDAEVAAATAVGALRDIREQLSTQRGRQQELVEESRLATVRLDHERDAMAQQVRMSYVTGRQEALKLLLNQESPEQLGRMVVYYDYLNRARSRRVEVIETELATLTQLEKETVQVAGDLRRLEVTQATEVDKLESSRNDRRAVLASLEQDIAASDEEIRRLRAESQRLGDLVAEIEKSPELFPPEALGGFPSVEGELEWPVAGSLISDFGDARAGGQLRWNGIVIDAPGGTAVQAVYYGRVAYADWLPGLGLLIILDHGAGYMSLYGHNEALLKVAGDWVVLGETIAHVGDSGGQTRTALYFEIRRDGEPIDPHRWMARDP